MSTGRIPGAIRDFYASLSISGTSRWMLYGVGLGIITGILGLVYSWALGGGIWLIQETLAGFRMPQAGSEGSREGMVIGLRWALLILPGLGGLVVGLMHRFYTSYLVDATNGYVNAFHNRRARVNPLKPLWRLLSSVFTISTAGSVGKEGPVIFAASSVGSFAARLFRLPDSDRAILMVCGAGGGLGAVFRAPVGGALYAAEVLYRQADFEAEAVMPAIITSVTAYAVFALFGNWMPIFSTPHYHFRILDLPFFALLGLIISVFAFIYERSLKYADRLFHFIRIPSWLKPALGGLMLGILIFFLPEVAGPGYGVLQVALSGKMIIWMMLVVAVGKMLATSLTVGSGGSGGIFAPSLVIGGLLGGAMGLGLSMLGAPIQPEAYVLVGMGAFLSAAAKVPLAAIVMVCEMAGNYELLVPMTLASSLAFLVSRRFTIYPAQVENRWESPLHRGEFAVDVLEDITAGDAMKAPDRLPHFHPFTPVSEALEDMVECHNECFPVEDESGNLVGVLLLEDLRAVIFGEEIRNVRDMLLVEDVMRFNTVTLSPDDDLHKALEQFVRGEVEELPVVEDGRFVGLLTKKGLIQAYGLEMERRLKNHRGG